MRKQLKLGVIALLLIAMVIPMGYSFAGIYPHTTSGTLVWDRITDKGQISRHSKHPEAKAWIARYAKHPKNLNKGLTRAEPFIYMFLAEAEARGLPSEFALLPMVESMYDPTANSHMGAGGIWQMMRPTGRRFGLLQDGYYDGRFDIQASTEAALNYLVILGNRYHGDWLKAAAAYNCGEGNVDRAIKRNKAAGKPTDFWSLRLPKETKDYVPKLIAIAAVVAHPERHNIKLPAILNKPYITHVDIGSQKSLAEVAALSGLSLDEIIHYNPAYPQLITHPNGPSHVMLPIANADVLQSKLHCLKTMPGLPKYRVKKGDTLGKIAGSVGTSVQALKRTNRLASDTIHIGQELVLPA